MMRMKLKTRLAQYQREWSGVIRPRVERVTNMKRNSKKSNKRVGILLTVTFVIMLLTGCQSQKMTGLQSILRISYAKKQQITVVSREDGSGTRGAFTGLFGIEQLNQNGKKEDFTTFDAIVTNSTQIMMTTVAADEYAIGYTSLGTVNSTVKVLKVDGVMPSVQNIENKSYPYARPFNVVTKGTLSEVAQDFMNYIYSADGEKIITADGYIAVVKKGSYRTNNLSGKLIITGSSSVAPVMEKLIESYQKLNKHVTIEMQESDSTTGIIETAEGKCDIGMASRELSEKECDKGLQSQAIARDGIVIIVNPNNPKASIKAEEVKNIYLGEITDWQSIKN
jgi:phosphate transport system substrate-binding protein